MTHRLEARWTARRDGWGWPTAGSGCGRSGAAGLEGRAGRGRGVAQRRHMARRHIRIAGIAALMQKVPWPVMGRVKHAGRGNAEPAWAPSRHEDDHDRGGPQCRRAALARSPVPCAERRVTSVERGAATHRRVVARRSTLGSGRWAGGRTGPLRGRRAEPRDLRGAPCRARSVVPHRGSPPRSPVPCAEHRVAPRSVVPRAWSVVPRHTGVSRHGAPRSGSGTGGRAGGPWPGVRCGRSR